MLVRISSRSGERPAAKNGQQQTQPPAAGVTALSGLRLILLSCPSGFSIPAILLIAVAVFTLSVPFEASHISSSLP